MIAGITPPRYLYHWTTTSNLSKIAGEKNMLEQPNWNAFSMRASGEKPTGFYGNWPQFAEIGHGGLFTWTHPILAMKGGEFENYGNRLVRIEIDPSQTNAVRVVRRYMYSNMPVFQSPLDVNNVDLVDNGREWIITNPRAIKTFTADINVLRPTLELELARLLDPNHRYAASDIHFKDFKLFLDEPSATYVKEVYYDYAERIIRDLLATPPGEIPSWFRRDEFGQPIQAEWRTGPQANDAIRARLAAQDYEREVRAAKAFLEDVAAGKKPVDAPHIISELKARVTVYCASRMPNCHAQPILDWIRELEKMPARPSVRLAREETMRKITSRLRAEPFDPYPSFLDSLLNLMQTTDSYGTDFHRLNANIQNSPGAQHLYEAYTKHRADLIESASNRGVVDLFLREHAGAPRAGNASAKECQAHFSKLK